VFGEVGLRGGLKQNMLLLDRRPLKKHVTAITDPAGLQMRQAGRHALKKCFPVQQYAAADSTHIVQTALSA